MVRETRHLWVGNLPETVREDRIREHFKRYGRVQSVKILTDKQNQRLQDGAAGTAGSPNFQLSTATNSTIDYGGGGGKDGGDDDRCGGGLNRASSVNSNSSSGDSCQTTTGGGSSKPKSDCSTPNSNINSCRGGDAEATTTVNSSTVNSSNNSSHSTTTTAAAAATNSNHVSRTIPSSNSAGATPGGNGLLHGGGSVCATVAFMDIKSASKAHTAEHKFDDRILTTEYYEPSSIPSYNNNYLNSTTTASNLLTNAKSPPSSSGISNNIPAGGALGGSRSPPVGASALMSPGAGQQQQQLSSSHQHNSQQPLPNTNNNGGAAGANPVEDERISSNAYPATTTTTPGTASSTNLMAPASAAYSSTTTSLGASASIPPQSVTVGVGGSQGTLSQNHLSLQHPTLGSSPQQKQYSAVGPSSLATRFPSNNNNNNNVHNSVNNSSSSNIGNISSNNVVPSSTSSATTPVPAAVDMLSPKEDVSACSPFYERTMSTGSSGSGDHYNNNSSSSSIVGGGSRRHLMGYHNTTGNGSTSGGGAGTVQGGRRDRLYIRNGSYSNSIVDRSNSMNMHLNSHCRGGGGGVGGNPWQSSSTCDRTSAAPYEANVIVNKSSLGIGCGVDGGGGGIGSSGDNSNVRRSHSVDQIERRISESGDGPSGMKGLPSASASGAAHHQPATHHSHNQHHHAHHPAGYAGKQSGGAFSTNSSSNSGSSSGVSTGSGGLGGSAGLVVTRSSRCKMRTGSETPPEGGAASHHNHIQSGQQPHGNHHPHHAVGGGGGNVVVGGTVLGSDCLSSRSHSRSPSSCSSSNSTSSHGSAESPLQGAASKSHLDYSHQVGGLDHSSTAATLAAVAASRSSRVSSSGGNSSDQAGPSSGSVGNSSSGGGLHADDNKPLAICVRNLPVRSSDTSLKDGLFHEYKKHGKVTSVKVVGLNSDRYALVCFKKRDDVEKALEVSRNKLFFGSKIDVVPYAGYDVEDNEFRPYEAELDENHPKATRTLFIGNLEKEISNSELWKSFECFGEIIEIDIKKQGTTAYAFCQYSDIVSVVKAMRKMDGEHLGSNRIKLGFGKSMPTNCVWLDGVAESVTESHLGQQFNRFGHVAQVVIDPERHLALVFFEQIQYAQMAVKEMRGFSLRGKKLQIDFASRECQDAFFDKLEKAGHGDRNPNGAQNRERGGFEGRNFGRNYDNQSRSRTSSFSRHGGGGNASGGNSGATSPISTSERVPVAGGTTPRGAGRPRTSRYLSNAEYFGDSGSEFAERRNVRSYDEYSQGSAASHDDLYENPTHGPASAPLTGTEPFNYPMRATNEASLRVNRSNSGDRGDHLDRRSRLGSVGCDSPPPISAVARIDMDITSASALALQRRRTEKSPGDIRHLQKERVHLLEQLEGCPSSGDELISPKKRLRYDPSMGDVALPNSSLANEPVVGDSIDRDNASFVHHGPGGPLQRKVEVRRLSESSQKLLLAASNNLVNANQLAQLSRRPSVDRHHGGVPEANYYSSSYQPSSVSKRRRTGDSNCSGGAVAAGNQSDHVHQSSHPPQIQSLPHSLRGRAHPMPPQTSHEASGGESADGSRPGTPLCDERPENLLPTEPRPLPRDRPHEPMVLPLPKWAILYYQQHRMLKAMEMHSGNASNVASALPTLPTLLSHAPSQLAAAVGLRDTGMSSPSSVRSTSPNKFPSTNSHHSALYHLASGHASSRSLEHGGAARPGLEAAIVSSADGFMPPSPSLADRNVEPVSPHGPLSSSSNGSDSEMGSSNASPSFAERIKMLDEMLEKVNGSNSRSSVPTPTTPHIPSLTTEFSRSKEVPATDSGFRSRFDVKVVGPSDILKSVLAKKSIFDEDSKRLENIGDKYEPSDYQNLIRQSPQIVSTAAATTFVPMSSPSSNQTPSTPTTPNLTKPAPLPNLSGGPPNLSRLNIQHVSTPLQSPQIPAGLGGSVTSSVNSPLPGSATPGGSGSSSSGLLTPVKGLQYPFPSHPPAPVTQPPPMPPLPPLPPNPTTSSGSATAHLTNVQPPLPPSPAHGPKTPAVSKSISLHESTPTKVNVVNKPLCKSISLPSNSGPEDRSTSKKGPEEEEIGHHKREPSKIHSSGKGEVKNKLPGTAMAVGKAKLADDRAKSVPTTSSTKKEDVGSVSKKYSERSDKPEPSYNEERDTEDRMKKTKHDKENVGDVNRLSKPCEAIAKDLAKSGEGVVAKIKEENVAIEAAHCEEKRKHMDSRNASPNRSMHSKRRLDSTDSADAEELKRSKLQQHGDQSSRSKSSKERDMNKSSRSKHSKSLITGTSKSWSFPVEIKPEESHNDEAAAVRSVSVDEKSTEEKKSSVVRKMSLQFDQKVVRRDKPTDTIHDDSNAYDREFIDRMEEQQNMKIRSSDEEQQIHMQKIKLKKEKKREKYRRREEEKRSGEKSDAYNRNEDGKSSCSSDNSGPGDNMRSCNLSTDTDDSDGPRKHSIFDIPEEVGPAYISMYDKVKARSCKNMQKQEEEKKIKAKFSQLKQSRAKRDGKRSNWFGSDSDGYNSSSDDDTSEGEHSLSKKHHKDPFDMDSDERARLRARQMRELCDGDSSESSSAAISKSRQKIMSRKNSRSTRIESDSSDDAASHKSTGRLDDKPSSLSQPCANVVDKPASVVEALDETAKCPIETPKADGTEKELPNPNNKTNEYWDGVPDMMKKTFPWGPFYFNEEAAKNKGETKKKSKRGKSLADEDEKDEAEAAFKPEEPTPHAKPASSTDVDLFDELKKDVPGKMGERSSKKKHSSSRKDRRREKSGKDDHENRSSKDDKSRTKKEKKRSTDAVHESEFGSLKRDEKMEEIFGPLSDDDTNTSFAIDSTKVDVAPLVPPVTTATPPVQSTPVLQGFVKAEPVGDAPTAKSSSAVKTEHRHLDDTRSKDEVRKMKKEKKRRERERSRSVVAKEDENSVDLDEAGRALEAQLLNELNMAAKEVKVEPQSSDAPPSHRDMNDVLRLTDGGEESSENVSTHPASANRDKEAEHRHAREKRKKKKRSKEEKQLRREHSSTSSTKQVATDNVRAQVDPNTANSLPSLLEDSPTCPASNASDVASFAAAKIVSVDPKRTVKVEKFIPGFGSDLDRQMSESAVKSISAELDAKPVEPLASVKAEPIDEPLVILGSKLDDKASRALISQEETDDAVAALLGESFASSSADFECYPAAGDFEEALPPAPIDIPAVIPEEDAEEMRKAVQSLNTEDMKIDTPQSEHDLQIDTDTEQDELDTTKSSRDSTVEKKPVELPKPEAPVEVVKSVITKSPAPVNVKTTSSESPAKEHKPIKRETPVKSNIEVNLPSVGANVSPKPVSALPTEKPLLVHIPPSNIQSNKPQSSPQLNYSPTGSVGQLGAIHIKPQQHVQLMHPHPNPQKVAVQSPTPRPVGPYAVHPPTINIPEQYVVQHTIPSPRAPNDPRMVSPRMQQHFVKASSPHSPTVRAHGPRQSPQLSPVILAGQSAQMHSHIVNPHLLQQHRQMMSPTSPNQQQILINARPGQQNLPGQHPATPTMVRVVQTAGQPMHIPPKIVVQPGQGMAQLPGHQQSQQGPPKMLNKSVIESLAIAQQHPQQIQINIPKHSQGTSVLQQPSPGPTQAISSQPMLKHTDAAGCMIPKLEKEADNVSVIKSVIIAEAGMTAEDTRQTPLIMAAHELKKETVIKNTTVDQAAENVKPKSMEPEKDSDQFGDHEQAVASHYLGHSPTDPNVSKRGRGRGTGRAKKVSISEPVPPPSPSSKPTEMVDPATAGVQTRRGGGPPKGGQGRKSNRGGGRGGARGGASGGTNSTSPGHVLTAAERKARSQNSESDVYEFHDDSGEDDSSGRPRGTQSGVVKGPEGTVQQPPPPPPPHAVSISQPGLVHSPEQLPIQHESQQQLPSLPQLQSPPPMQMDPHHKQVGDDFTTPSSTNTRKSRRLQERDGTRTTVDDIIEDVVKNVPNSPKSFGQTPPRRSTRSASGGSSKGDGLNSDSDVKKSPRSSRKPRKNSENSADSEDDMFEHRNEEMPLKDDAYKGELQRPAVDALAVGDQKTNLQMAQQMAIHQPLPGTPTKVPVTISNSTSVVTSVGKGMPSDMDSKHGAAEEHKVKESIVNVTVQYAHPAAQAHPHPSVMAGQKMPTITTAMSQSQPVITSSSAVPGVQISIPTLTTTTAHQHPAVRSHPLKTHVLSGQGLAPARGPPGVHPQSAPMLMVNVDDYSVPKPMQHSPVVTKVGAPQMPPGVLTHQQHQQMVINKGRDQGAHGNATQLQQQQSSSSAPESLALGKPTEQPQNLVVKIQSQHPEQMGPNAGPSTQGPTPQVVHHAPGKPPQSHQMHPAGQQQLIMQGNKIIGLPGQGMAVYQSAIPSGATVSTSHIVKVPQPPPPSSSHVIQMQQQLGPGIAGKGPIPQPLQIPSTKVEYITTASGQSIAKVQVAPPGTVIGPPGGLGPKGQVVIGHTMTPQQQIAVIQQQQAQQQHMIHVAQQQQQQAIAKHHMQQQQAQQGGGQQQQQPPHILPANKGLHQAPQILTGAVASPPLKQPHLASQQPIVTGASSSRVSIPHISPQGPSRHMLQAGLPVSAFEANMHGELAGFSMTRSQSPPPAHQQQVSPITPADFRPLSREQYIAYQSYMKAQQEALSLGGARYPSYHKSRSPLLPGAIDQNQPEQLEDSMGASAPLELRRVNTPGARSTISIPQSLQSPGDRATDSPQVAQVYVPGTRFPHPHYPEAGARYYDNNQRPLTAEPPPAHRPHNPNPVGVAAAAQNLGMVAPAGLPHIYAPYQKPIERASVEAHREQQQRDREREPRTLANPGHSNMPTHGTMVPSLPGPTIGRSLQVATPPHASQVPPQADSLQMLLQRYPVMWQGLLALKNDQAAVQMHFVFGNAQVADDSLPRNVDGTIPLRIAQRMRLEQTQLEGVARKMQTENEHCMLLALPCGRDHMDVLQQSTNLQSGFITYLQQKQAAGIVNIAAPGSQNAAFVVHIFPSCEFANENLARIAPDLLHRVADIAHLLIVIATV